MFDVFRAFRGEGGIERNFFAAYAAGGAVANLFMRHPFDLQRPNFAAGTAFEQEALPRIALLAAKRETGRKALASLNPSVAQADHH
jgi:hypothetical protein